MLFFQLFINYIVVAIATFCGSALSLNGNTHDVRSNDRVQASCKLKVLQPQGTYCKATGQLKRGHNFVDQNPSYATSYNECLNLCSRRRTPHLNHVDPYQTNVACTTFAYSPTKSTCKMYYEDLKRMGFKPGDGDSDTLYSDLRCFNCPAPCGNIPFNVNLLDNGGFESPLFGPWQGNNYSTLVRTPGFNSAHRIHCGPSVCQINQKFTSCSEYFYRTRFQYQATPAQPHKNVLELSTEGGNSNFAGNGNRTLAEAWYQPYTGIIDGFEILFVPEKAKTGFTHLDLDNFEVVRVSEESFKSAPGALEFVPNGGFESGEIAPWKTRGAAASSFKVRRPGINSSYALHWTSISKEIGYLSQSFPVRPNIAYVLKYNLRKAVGTEFPTMTYNNQLMFPPRSQFHGNRQDYVLPMRVTQNNVHIEFTFPGPGSAVLDNISFKELDE